MSAAVETPAGKLGPTVETALDGVEESFGARLAIAAGSEGQGGAAEIPALLEAAERAEARLHGLAVTPEPDDSPASSWALAGAWLRARAAELAAELGGRPLERTARALREVAGGWAHEAMDLYDAGRSPERCLRALDGARGGLGALAAALGALDAGREPRVVADLADCGRELAVAARIGEQVLELAPGSGLGGELLARGVYGLPVALSLERDPGLARSLGGAIPEGEIDPLLERIRAAGGPAEAGDRRRELVERAVSRLEPIEGSEPVRSLAKGILNDD